MKNWRPHGFGYPWGLGSASAHRRVPGTGLRTEPLFLTCLAFSLVLSYDLALFPFLVGVLVCGCCGSFATWWSWSSPTLSAYFWKWSKATKALSLLADLHPQCVSWTISGRCGNPLVGPTLERRPCFISKLLQPKGAGHQTQSLFQNYIAGYSRNVKTWKQACASWNP